MPRNFTFAPIKGQNPRTTRVTGYKQVKAYWGGFNMLVNHARYDRAEMDKLVPNATYITILRNPVDHFISAFIYYNYSKQVGLSFSNDLLSKFFSVEANFAKLKFGRSQASDGIAYDLSFKAKGNRQDQILKLNREFDLVLLSEYFDESLLLLKKLLCWEIDDLLYLPIRKHSTRYDVLYNISDEIRAGILEHNRVDADLYHYFNRTFWEKVNSYGASFDEDLKDLRNRLNQLQIECKASLHERFKGRFIRYDTKSNASKRCQKFFVINESNAHKERRLLKKRLKLVAATKK